jgi:RimJ/RimL family protein N-acetyltransferase
MALAIPLLPGLPAVGPRPKGRRRCAAHLEHAWTLTPLVDPTPGQALYDFLALWYARVREIGEHASLWGEVGLSPSRFVGTFAQIPMVLLHHERTPWPLAEGLMMAVWLDDIVPDLRARCHQWVAPPYRHPRVSTALGHVLLRYLFDEMGFELLEGRTPVDNHLGVRYARRLGFRAVTTLPYGEWEWTPDGTKTMTPVVQSQLLAADWRHAQGEL